MTTPLSAQDERFLARAIEISRQALEDEGKTPFGAIVVIAGEIVGGAPAALSSCGTRPPTPKSWPCVTPAAT